MNKTIDKWKVGDIKCRLYEEIILGHTRIRVQIKSEEGDWVYADYPQKWLVPRILQLKNLNN